MTITTSTGVVLAIGTTAEDPTGDTFTPVGEITEIGEFGDRRELVTFASLSDGRLRKLKGIADGGDLNLVVGFDAGDAGQVALIAAADDTTSNAYNIRITFNDQPGGGTNPSSFDFKAVVNSKALNVGGPNNPITRNVQLAITSAVDETLAA